MDEEQAFFDGIDTQTRRIITDHQETPVAILVPACMTVVLNGVLAAPTEDVARSMLATIEKMVGHIRESVDLKFNAPVGRVH